MAICQLKTMKGQKFSIIVHLPERETMPNCQH